MDDVSDGSHVVTATTPNGGPTVRLLLRPYLKMEFWSGGEVVQTSPGFRQAALLDTAGYEFPYVR